MEPLPPNAPDELVIDGGSGDEIRFTKVEGRGQLLVYEASLNDVIGTLGTGGVIVSRPKPEEARAE